MAPSPKTVVELDCPRRIQLTAVLLGIGIQALLGNKVEHFIYVLIAACNLSLRRCPVSEPYSEQIRVDRKLPFGILHRGLHGNAIFVLAALAVRPDAHEVSGHVLSRRLEPTAVVIPPGRRALPIAGRNISEDSPAPLCLHGPYVVRAGMNHRAVLENDLVHRLVKDLRLDGDERRLAVATKHVVSGMDVAHELPSRGSRNLCIQRQGLPVLPASDAEDLLELPEPVVVHEPEHRLHPEHLERLHHEVGPRPSFRQAAELLDETDRPRCELWVVMPALVAIREPRLQHPAQLLYLVARLYLTGQDGVAVALSLVTVPLGRDVPIYLALRRHRNRPPRHRYRPSRTS